MQDNTLVYDISEEVRFFGRTYEKNGEYYFNWSASGFTFSFIGSGARAVIASDAPEENQAYIKIYVDGAECSVVKLTEAENTVTLAEGLDPTQKHVVKVLKRSNVKFSTASLVRLMLTDGKKLAPEPQSGKYIEFIGDSLTVGYATVANGAQKWSTDTEDPTLTHAGLIASAFDADYSVVAISGWGVARSTSGDTERLIPKIYPFVDQCNLPDVPYDFHRQPDVIVINLGTNDESSKNTSLTTDEFGAALRRFLESVRENNPDAYVFYGYGMLKNRLLETVKSTVQQLRDEGDDRIFFVLLSKLPRELVAIGHPMAPAYIPWSESFIEEIRRVTGW